MSLTFAVESIAGVCRTTRTCKATRGVSTIGNFTAASIAFTALNNICITTRTQKTTHYEIKVIDFGTNRKRVSYLALFQRYQIPLMTPQLIHPILGVFPLDQIIDDAVNPSTYFKLFGRETIFQVFQIIDDAVNPSTYFKLFGRETIFQVFQPM